MGKVEKASSLQQQGWGRCVVVAQESVRLPVQPEVLGPGAAPVHHAQATPGETLVPQPSERILEIGPGTGYYTLHVARALQPNGSFYIFHLQQEMLDHTMRRGDEAVLENLVPQQEDAQKLPYDDASFDGVYLVMVLGEMRLCCGAPGNPSRSQAGRPTRRGRTLR